MSLSLPVMAVLPAPGPWGVMNQEMRCPFWTVSLAE
jgi:hypothetical protein